MGDENGECPECFFPGLIDPASPGLISVITDSLNFGFPGVTGGGILATLTFSALAAGDARLGLLNVLLQNTAEPGDPDQPGYPLNLIPCDAANGCIQNGIVTGNPFPNPRPSRSSASASPRWRANDSSGRPPGKTEAPALLYRWASSIELAQSGAVHATGRHARWPQRGVCCCLNPSRARDVVRDSGSLSAIRPTTLPRSRSRARRYVTSSNTAMSSRVCSRKSDTCSASCSVPIGRRSRAGCCGRRWRFCVSLTAPSGCRSGT